MQATYSGFSGQLATVIKAYTQAIGQPLPDVLVDQANKLSCSDFGDGKRGLFQEAADLAPSMEEIFALPVKLDWHIKRRGRPVLTMYEQKAYKKGPKKGQMREVRRKGADGKNMKAGEIQRRLAARYYQATGWLSEVLAKEIKSGRLKRQACATVYLKLTGDVLSVTLTNPRKNSAEVNLAHGDYVQKALNARVADMLEYVNRHLDRVTVQFGGRELKAAA
jgi:hypothetical protein